MGLTMDDSNLATIHVPSDPTSYAQERPNYDGLTLKQLIDRKDNLEAELKALGAVLDSHGVTMQSSLTTFDGYPRADIDVAQVRVTRARIIHLRNDWKELMDKIEQGLHQHHADLKVAAAQETENTETDATTSSSSGPPPAPEAPFAKVNSVEAASPANEAGLKAGDLIRRFGTAIWSNHERLRKVGEVVQQNTGKPILVQVSRKNGEQTQELDLRVTPRQGWGGRGSLGCHILPL